MSRYRPPAGYDPNAWAAQIEKVLAEAPEPSEEQILLAVSYLHKPAVTRTTSEAA